MTHNHDRRNWTDSEDTIIRQAWRDGTQVSVIAEQLGGTRRSIIGRANRIGCGQHPGVSMPIHEPIADSPAADRCWKPRIAFQGRRLGWEPT